MKRLPLFFSFLFAAANPLFAYAEVTLSANGESNTYSLIESKLGTNPIEAPDICGVHNTDHITQYYDSGLNEYVFYFHAHIPSDDQDCTSGRSDRQRTEIKVTPYSGWNYLKGVENEWHTYRWRFRFASTFKAGSGFAHIFQIKAKPPSGKNLPIVTLSPKNDVLRLIHRPDNSTANVVATIPLSHIKGKWIEAYVRTKYADGNNGSLKVTLRQLDTGTTVLDWYDGSLDMWRPDGTYNRPKWGIYRSIEDTSGMQTEHARFDDFCIAEGSDTCPSYFDPPSPPPPPPSCPYYDPETGRWIQCP